MFVVVVGAGRFGSLAAQALAEQGVSVTIIDQSLDILETLPESFSGFRLEGDAAELETLKRSRMDEADVVLAVTESDSLNLLVAQLARELFGVTRVVARIFDPVTESVYKHLDVTILCPTTLGLDNLLSGLLNPEKPGGSNPSKEKKDG
ncbi:MAG: TrkA family potassium uptake protein [Candidatus Eisenbacteria bacterium]|uniref:TrkA family potassium uptake protein n=1 Tax=Eiseniibacteriota bacterium TaxID=2212470 RepID=A0A948RTI6_UNCEI|nr:TrkA family potassium uptake protein [Candidatus Eisenbacteria bacterium]MBU1949598.1 TrkA family potassium uptake protein [Candidatus Eisenbacteria bacterium]MBU2690740.1 TrkA family potassium uptake protein [Candidatus Eisenbacteria bacterium]